MNSCQPTVLQQVKGIFYCHSIESCCTCACVPGSHIDREISTWLGKSFLAFRTCPVPYDTAEEQKDIQQVLFIVIFVFCLDAQPTLWLGVSLRAGG